MPDRWILRKNQFCFGSKEFAYPSRLSERKSRLLFFLHLSVADFNIRAVSLH